MYAIFLPVFLFAVTMTITPGPNNMLLTASGARFGYKRTLPFIGGIAVGITSQLTLSALGLGVLFDTFPVLRTLLKIAGTIYLLYLAVKIAFSKGDSADRNTGERPLRLLEGAAFQYLNPKAYVMCITAMAVYPLDGEGYFPSAILIIAVFLAVAPLANSAWALFGVFLGKLMRASAHAQKVRFFLGGITAASVVFILV